MGSVLKIDTAGGLRTVPFEELEQMATAGRVPVAELLDDDAAATHVTFESRDGGYRASIPLDQAQRGVVVVETAGTLRLMIEDGETLCWNVKDLGRIHPTVGKESDSVPEDPPH